MSAARQPTRGRRNRFIFLIAATLAAGVCLALWLRHPDPAYWQALWHELHGFLERHPATLLLLLATLPGIGFPVSPLLVLFGLVMGPRIGLPAACALGILAQSFCSIWTYWLAVGPLRAWLKGLVLRRHSLPEVSRSNAVQIGLLLRLTPGIPYALQNVALGVIGLPFGIYLLVSLPVQSLYTVAFIVTGGAIFEGRAGLAVTAGLLLVALVVATRLVSRHRRRNGRPDPPR